MTFPRPAATTKILDTSRRPGDNDNVGLWLDKLVYHRRGIWDIKEDYRAYALDQFTRSWRSPLCEHALKRRWHALQATHGKELCVRFHARVHGRLLVDYGRAATSEAALSMHHTWGVPRIPGSAIKGITLLAMREQEDKTADDIEAIFGTQLVDNALPANPHAGQVLFFDALPENGAFTLAADVLTPHYGPYYLEGEPPGDWHSPKPHTFLTVVDTTFVFHLAVQPLPGVKLEAAKTWLDSAQKTLLEALDSHGIGAKTAAGYGRLRKVDPPPAADIQELAAWFKAQKRDKVPQRTQLEQLRVAWHERLASLDKADRARAAEIVGKAITSPKLAAQRDAYMEELAKT